MADYIAVSNTGKTITISMSTDFHARWKRFVPIGCIDNDGRIHAHVVYDNGTIRINPAKNGRRVGTHANGAGGFYIGMSSRTIPSWPGHGKVVFPSPMVDGIGGVIHLVLPEVLPAPKLRSTASSRVHETRTDYSHVGPVREPYSAPTPDSPVQEAPAEPATVAPAPICHYGLFKVPAYQWETVKTVMEALGCTLADKISAL